MSQFADYNSLLSDANCQYDFFSDVNVTLGILGGFTTWQQRIALNSFSDSMAQLNMKKKVGVAINKSDRIELNS